MRPADRQAAQARATKHATPATIDDAVTEPGGRESDRATMSSTYARCPHCRAAAGVPVVYGHPSSALKAAATRGEVVLGDRMSPGDGTDPDRACTRCGHRWHSAAVSRVRRPAH